MVASYSIRLYFADNRILSSKFKTHIEMKWTPEKMRRLRKTLGYSQEQMARALGYKRYQTISEFERGERAPPTGTCLLLDALEKQLVGGNDRPQLPKGFSV